MLIIINTIFSQISRKAIKQHKITAKAAYQIRFNNKSFETHIYSRSVVTLEYVHTLIFDSFAISLSYGINHSVIVLLLVKNITHTTWSLSCPNAASSNIFIEDRGELQHVNGFIGLFKKVKKYDRSYLKKCNKLYKIILIQHF